MKNIDLLAIYPCHPNSLISIDNINSFHSMKAFFLNRSFKKISPHLKISSLFYPNFYQKSKNKYEDFLNLCLDQNIDINQVRNVLFGSVCMLGYFKYGLRPLMDVIPGRLIKIEDHEGKPISNNRIYTIGHYQKTAVSWNVIDAGLTVASDIFVPKQDWNSKILKIHVDHNYLNQPEIFKEIKTLLQSIETKTKNHPDWDCVKIYYHDRECSISNLGHFDFRPLPMSKLSDIYGSCHIGIMSHKESLGMYPLEILSSGAVLINHPELLVSELQNAYPYLNINNIDIDLLLKKEFLQHQSQEGRKHILKYDLDQYASKILSVIL